MSPSNPISDPFLKLAHARFQQWLAADTKQLQREMEDIEFYNGEQWPADIRASRAGQNASNGLPPVPARPCITVNKVRQPVRQVLNQERESEMGIEIVPADDFADVETPIDDTEIELREGLTRRIQRESQAKDARTWAAMRAFIAGRGYYGVMTKFVKNDLQGTPDPSWWDQDVYIQRFYNQSAVMLDPAHEQPDGSDAEWGMVGTWIPYDQYLAQFGMKAAGKVNALENIGAGDFTTFADEMPEWFKEEGPENKRVQMCRVVDYYYTERETKTLAWLADNRVMWASDVPSGAVIKDQREVTEKSIKWAKIDGVQKLDGGDWAGPYVPIIKVVGEELQPHDAERRCEGIVRPAREPGQGFNFMVSKWVEMIALAPLTPLMLAEGQAEGYEEWYNQANTRTLPYLPYKQTDLAGQKAPPPFPAPREVPIQPVAASVQMFDEAIKDTTGVPSVTLGDTDPSLKTARGAKLLLDQAKQGTNNYLDNLARSVRFEGVQINALLYPIYGARPGRLARIINGQGEAQIVPIDQPFTMAQGPGGQPRPQKVQPGTEGAKHYTLTKDAAFNVAIKVSRNTDTRREQEATMLGDMISSNPELMGVFGDLFFKNLDGPGHKEMAERAKAMLVPPVQKLLEGQQSGQASNPADQLKIQQMEQAGQALQAQLQQAMQALQTEQAKQQATIEKAHVDAQTDLQKAEIQAKADLAKAQLQMQTDVEIARMKAGNDRALQAAQMAHDDQDREDTQRFEHAENAVDRHHENVQLAAAHVQAEAQAAQEHRQGMEAGETAHDQALEQGEQGHQQAVDLLERQPTPEAKDQ